MSMNGIFNWKENSDRILSECFNNTVSVPEEDDHNSVEEEDDLAMADNSIFEMACINRELELLDRPELYTNMHRWRQLTNIYMCSDVSRKESPSVDTTCVQSHDENGNTTYIPNNCVVKEHSEEKSTDENNQNSQVNTMSPKDSSVDFEIRLVQSNVQQQVTSLRVESTHSVLSSVE